MELKRVVVTGIGALTPIGNTKDEYWKALNQGISGAAPITRFDASKFRTQFACELKGFDSSEHFDRKKVRTLDPFSQYGVVCAREAVEDSGINNISDKSKIGVIWGAGIGGLYSFQKEVEDFVAGNRVPRFNPFFIPKMIVDICAGHISMEYGFKGVNFATVSACASSANALIDAFNYIRLGKAKAIVAGGSEAAVTEAGIGGFNGLKALSTRNESPQTASRPFDKTRDGFVLGEGAGCLILEELDHAIERGAKIYAEVGGGGLSADAYHLTAPHPEGEGAMAVMEDVLNDSGLQKEDVDHINMHGTSTPLGDVAEAKAIEKVFGEHAYKIQINSTKSMTGHLLGAAGAIEAIATLNAICNDVVAPTINFTERDENINEKLDFTFNKAVKREINVAISNTFGFGGHNACVLMKKFKT